MTLQQPYSCVDRYGATWSIIGGPFEGLYRNAAVVHDAACRRQSRTWEDSARMFHEAMRANGVGIIRAYVMYAAVYMFGPHWKTVQKIQISGHVESSQVDQQVRRAFSLSTSTVSISPTVTEERDGSKVYLVTIAPLDKTYAPDDLVAVRDAIEKQAETNADGINLEWVKEQISDTVHARLAARAKVAAQAEAARQ